MIENSVLLSYSAILLRENTNKILSLYFSGDGGWDITNISVAYINNTFIRCNSTHLTCFAVLVDIHGETSGLVITHSLLFYFVT